MDFNNILAYDSNKKLNEYDELVEKFGLDKALEIMSSTGDIYDGDVVEDKKNKLIFDDEKIEQLASHLKAPEEIEISLPNQDEIEWTGIDMKYHIDGQESLHEIIAPSLDRMKINN